MAKFALLMGLTQAVTEQSEHTAAAQAGMPMPSNLTPDGEEGRCGREFTRISENKRTPVVVFQWGSQDQRHFDCKLSHKRKIT